MSQKSLVYRHIRIYRFLMNVLYAGKYEKRFLPIINLLKAQKPNSRVLELCFGDTYIAEFCRKAGLQWYGLDINSHFVARATKNGFNAACDDVAELPDFPKSDVCVIIGSLYHFHDHAGGFIEKVFRSSEMLLISEPVSNLSNSRGLAGYVAKRAADAGKGHEQFRYDAKSLLETLEKYSASIQYRITFVHREGKDLVIKLEKNGNG